MIKLIKALSAIRCELQDMNIKKSGKNQHAGFSYYELGDILPAINKLEQKYESCSTIRFNEGFATLTFFNGDNFIDIASCNTADAMTKRKDGGNAVLPIQAEGSMQTYIRRYLYMMGYGVVENDWVDCLSNEQEELQCADKRKKLYAIAGVKGYNKTKVEAMSEKKYGERLPYVTDEQYAEMYEGFKKLPDKQ